MAVHRLFLPARLALMFRFTFGGSEFVTAYVINCNLLVVLNNLNAFMHSYDWNFVSHVFLHLLSHSIVPGDQPETP